MEQSSGPNADERAEVTPVRDESEPAEVDVDLFGNPPPPTKEQLLEAARQRFGDAGPVEARPQDPDRESTAHTDLGYQAGPRTPQQLGDDHYEKLRSMGKERVETPYPDRIDGLAQQVARDAGLSGPGHAEFVNTRGPQTGHSRAVQADLDRRAAKSAAPQAPPASTTLRGAAQRLDGIRQDAGEFDEPATPTAEQAQNQKDLQEDHPQAS